ncbi:MAG: SIMPL domain-containing protein [Gaiellaceae bacterium]
MKRIRRTILVAALVLGAAAIAGVAQPRLAHTATAAGDRTITVSGNGAVVAVPDRAGFSFGVDTKAATASDALARNATVARALGAALKAAGVAAADLQTTDISLNPQTAPDGSSIVGYDASSSVSATVVLAQAGAVVDAAVGAGATNVAGPSLSRSDQAALTNQALAMAVDDAKVKAQALAAAAGLQLGAVQSIVEGGAPTPLPFAGKASFAPASTPVEPGTLETDATVTVTYAAG